MSSFRIAVLIPTNNNPLTLRARGSSAWCTTRRAQARAPR
jgi:hypothetical protein